MSLQYPVYSQGQPATPQPKSAALRTTIIIRNLCITLVAAVFLMYPALVMWVNVFAPEMIVGKEKTDPISDTGKWVMILGSGPAFAALGIAHLIENLLKNKSVGIICLIIGMYTVAFFVAMFVALAILVLLTPMFSVMRGGAPLA